MDVLNVYSDSDSDSSSPISPEKSSSHSPTPALVPSSGVCVGIGAGQISSLETIAHSAVSAKRPVKLVTGCVEQVSFDDTKFAALERSLETTGSTVDPRSGKIITAPLQRNKSRIKLPPSSQAPKSAFDYDVDNIIAKPAAKRLRVSEASKPVNPNILKTGKDSLPFMPTTQFHARVTKDYQNRLWVQPPSSMRTFSQLETYTPYIPKRTLLSTLAHEGGVTSTNFFPNYGHLLLTAGLDGSACVWSVDSMSRIRTYHGHTKGIRDSTFSLSGDSFLTASYDKHVRLWDTESGRVIGSYATGSTPLCVRFSPPHNGSEFLAACSDKKVVQIDVRDASKIVQQYDHYMGAVNSISFIDDDRRFVSSSEDKLLRVWEYGTPVVIRYVSDPSAHSMPFTMLHPNRKWLVCQSMDNTIRVFVAREKFKPYAKKLFKGHLVAGYACGLCASPDGRFLVSGDGMGRMFFWDWKTTRLFQAIQAHTGVCSTIQWHSTRPSLLVSGGWDGHIKFWD